VVLVAFIVLVSLTMHGSVDFQLLPIIDHRNCLLVLEDDSLGPKDDRDLWITSLYTQNAWRDLPESAFLSNADE
jgi:hypothetical protein